MTIDIITNVKRKQLFELLYDSRRKGTCIVTSIINVINNK